MRKLLPAVILAAAAGPALANVVVKSRYTTDGQAVETTTSTSANRQRFDYGETKVIRQCDLNKIIQVDEKMKAYTVMALADKTGEESAPAPECAAKPVVSDAGEKKTILGFAATRRKAVTEGCAGKGGRLEVDGWFVAFENQASCQAADPAVAGLGFPLQYTLTAMDEKGSTTAASYQVLSLQVSETALDASLFEAPPGYREVSTRQAVAERNPAFLEAVAQGKASGKVRIGMASVVNQTGQPVSTAAVDGRLETFLRNPRIETVPLGGGTSEEIEARARQGQVDYILYSELTELKRAEGGSVGKRLGALSRAATMQPPKEAYTATLAFRLAALGSSTPELSSTATGSTGGFSLKDAIAIAQTASQFIVPMMMMRNMGGAGWYNILSATSSSSGYYSMMSGIDPAMMALQTTMQLGMEGMGGAALSADQEAAIAAAAEKVGKAVEAKFAPPPPAAKPKKGK